MYITFANPITLNRKNTINSSEKPAQLRKNNTELPKLCANQIYFTASLTTKSDRILQNLQNIEKLYNKIFVPAKIKYMECFDKKTIDLFNNLFLQNKENIIFKNGQNQTIAITNLTDENSSYVIKLSNTEINNTKFLKLSYSKDATTPNVLLINQTKIHQENSPDKYLNDSEILKLPSINLFDDGGEKIADILKTFNYFINSHIGNNIENYFITTLKNSLNLIKTLNNKLSTIEPQKRHALKRSCSEYLQFPRKKVFHLRDINNPESPSYALVPHRETATPYYRILTFDRIGNITNANLIDIEKGVLKNYCPQKKFNWATTKITPTNLETLNADELAQSKATLDLTKYYNLLANFSNHIDKNNSFSLKILNEKFNASNSIGYNSIKKTFLDKIPEILPPSSNYININFSNGEKFVLSKEKEHNFNIIKLTHEKDNNFVTTKIDADTTKIFQTNPNGEIIFDRKQNPLYVNSKSNTFRFKTKLMKNFIKEALKTKPVDLNINLQSQMDNLRETFTISDEIWKNMSRTKKTDFIKICPSIVEARGCTGEIRFKIPEKNYQLGLKPQKLDSSEFMRFSIYNEEGKLQKAFLINDFTKIVDNYCTKGYTKDSISRIPPNIIYKTEEQITKENIPEFIEEYLTELTKFETEAKNFSIDKRLK